MHFNSVVDEKKPTIVDVYDNEIQNPIETPKSLTKNNGLFFEAMIFAICFIEFGFVAVFGFFIDASVVFLNNGTIWIKTENPDKVKVGIFRMVEFLWIGIIIGIFFYFILQFIRLYAGIRLKSSGFLKKWIKSRVSLTLLMSWIGGLLIYYRVGVEPTIALIVFGFVGYFLASTFVMMAVVKKQSKSTTRSAFLD